MTELALQEPRPATLRSSIFALSVVFVFLRSLRIRKLGALPLAIILIVPLAVLAALLGVSIRGFDNNVLTRSGLSPDRSCREDRSSSWNSPARGEEEGKTPIEGGDRCEPAQAAADPDDRFRLHPRRRALVIATDPAPKCRQSLGTAALCRHARGFTVLGLFLTPVFYGALRSLRASVHRRPAPRRGE